MKIQKFNKQKTMIVNRKELLSALTLIGKVVVYKYQEDKYSCVQLRGVGDDIFLSFTNGYEVVNCKVKVDSAGPGLFGPVFVNRSLLRNTVKNMYTETVTFSTGINSVILASECGVATVTLPAESGHKDPLDGVSSVVKTKTDLTKDILSGFVKSAKPFVGSDMLRPAMNGILIERKVGDRIDVASTDSHILYNGWNRGYVSDLRYEIFIRSEAIPLVEQLLKSSKVVYVDICETHTNIYSLGISIRLQNKDLDFPNYRDVISKGSTLEVEMDKSELVRAISLALVTSKPYSSCMIVDVTTEDSIKISSDDLDFGLQSVQFVKAIAHGKLTRFAMNAKFLSTALKSVRTDRVLMGMKDFPSAITFKEVDNDDTQTIIVMPIMLDQYEVSEKHRVNAVGKWSESGRNW